MNKYDVAAIAATNNLDDNENRKLTAQEQKDIFGYTVVGRKNVRFDPTGQGTITVGRTVTGKDYVSRQYTYEEFAGALNEKQPVEAW